MRIRVAVGMEMLGQKVKCREISFNMSALYLTSSLLDEGILLHAVESPTEHVLLQALQCCCKELPDMLAVVSLLLPTMQGHRKDLNIVDPTCVPLQITAASILMV